MKYVWNIKATTRVLTNSRTTSLRPQSTAILVQPKFPRVEKKFSAFHGSRIDHEIAPVQSLTEINPVHALPSYILKIHFNIIVSSTPRSPKWSASPSFPPQNPACIYFYVPNAQPIPIFLILSPSDHGDYSKQAHFDKDWFSTNYLLLTIIVAPCIMESIYCLLTNKCTFY